MVLAADGWVAFAASLSRTLSEQEPCMKIRPSSLVPFLADVGGKFSKFLGPQNSMAP